MKFIRNGRVRDKIVDALAKGILIAFSALVCLWMISGARAAGRSEIVEIREKALDGGSHGVEFVLSKPVEKSDVSVDFQRNFIQVSLKGVSAYPAKTENLNHSLMEKVFTYQYQPDLARARVLLKSQASAVEGRSSWEVDGKTVRVLVRREGDASPPVASAKDSVKNRSSAPEEKPVDPEEQRARKEILKEAGAAAAGQAAKTADPENLPLFGQAAAEAKGSQAKERESGATKVFASLLLVIGVIGAGSLAFRRFVLGKGASFQRQGRMIEVVASQTLGPKRSIAIVKVLDQHMVVGMSGDGMNLLANLGTSVNLDRFNEEPGPGASFTDTLQSALSGGNRKGGGASASALEEPKMDLGFRASLKKRLEGFKPL